MLFNFQNNTIDSTEGNVFLIKEFNQEIVFGVRKTTPYPYSQLKKLPPFRMAAYEIIPPGLRL